MKQDFSDLEEALKRADYKLAGKILSKIDTKNLPTRFALSYIRSARRARLPLLGLKYYYRVIQEFDLRTLDPECVGEYVLCLHQIGSHTEASAHLSQLPEDSFARYHQIMAFSHIFRWNYIDSIAHLKKYLRLSELSNYERALTLINLTSAYFFSGYLEEARETLSQLSQELEGQNFPLLKGNYFELLAQFYFEKKDYQLSLETVQEAKKLLEPGTNYYYFAQKWQVLSELFLLQQAGKSPWERIGELDQFIIDVSNLNLWESVRDGVAFKAILLGDERLFNHVYYGTPFPAYQKRLMRMNEDQLPVWPVYEYSGEIVSGARRNTFDLGEGMLLNSQRSLKKHPILFRLLHCLTGDFFRPVSTGEIFSNIYRGECFDPFSSPDRVHQNVKRLRAWLKKTAPGLSVKNEEGLFSIHLERGWSILKKADAAPLLDEKIEALREMQNKASGNQLRSNELARLLGWSKSKVIDSLNYGIERGLVEKSGSGRATVYSFTGKKAS